MLIFQFHILDMQVPLNPDLPDASKVRKEEQRRIDDSAQLDEEEMNEKESLLTQVNKES